VDLYAKAFTFRNIASHPAMVVLPYQVSVMTIYEVYRLNVPLFVPSQRLLLRWQIDHNYSWGKLIHICMHHTHLYKGITCYYDILNRTCIWSSSTFLIHG
jgi:hypothetical protein